MGSDLLFGVLRGIVASTVFIVILLVGFSLLIGRTKLRKSGGKTKIVRSLDEMIGGSAEFFPPTVPRGPAEQLNSPELLEADTQD